MSDRLLRAVVVFLVALLLGTVGTFSHHAVIGVGPHNLPWGMTVALLAVACYLLGLRLVWGGRWLAALAALGILIPIGVFSAEGPGGSVIVQADAFGEVWEYVPLILAVVIVALPGLRSTATDRT